MDFNPEIMWVMLSALYPMLNWVMGHHVALATEMLASDIVCSASELHSPTSTLFILPLPADGGWTAADIY